MKVFLSLLKREFKLFWSNKVLVVLFLGAPIFYGVLLGYVYGKGKVTDLPVIVVDADNSILSQKIRQMFDDNEVISITKLLPTQEKLQDYIIEEGAACAVIIPKGFQKGVYGKKFPEVVTMVNASNVLTANYATSAINRVLSTLKAGIEVQVLTKKGIPKSIALKEFEPFKTTYIKKNNRATNYMYFLWPGVLGTLLQQVLLLGLALSFAMEFENNTFGGLVDRCRSATELILSKVLPYMLMSIAIWGCYLFFAYVFKMPFNDNIIPLTLITGLFVLSVCFIGILVSIIIPNQLKATEILMVIATPSFILSGFTWPLSQMPSAIQVIANTIPSTHYLKIVKVLLIQNGEVYQVTESIWGIAIIGLVSAILSFIILKIKIRKQLRQK